MAKRLGIVIILALIVAPTLYWLIAYQHAFYIGDRYIDLASLPHRIVGRLTGDNYANSLAVQVRRNQLNDCLRSQAKYQFVDSEHGLSFSHACFFEQPQTGTDSPLYPYYFSFIDWRKKNFDKPEYTIEANYLTNNELVNSDASFCNKHPGDNNCKVIKVGGVDATAYYRGIFNKSELVTVPNPKGGAITFLLHPITPEAQAQLDDMLNTFHFKK